MNDYLIDEAADGQKPDLKSLNSGDLDRSDEEGIPSPRNGEQSPDDNLKDLLERIQENRADDGEADLSIELEKPLVPLLQGSELASPLSRADKPAKKGKEDSPPTAAVRSDDLGGEAALHQEGGRRRPRVLQAQAGHHHHEVASAHLRIKTESKNVFSNYRIFQIKTQPGDIVVHRCREDFRWLTEKLREEYPNHQVIPIEKGQLSKNILEDYFDYLINKQGLNYSRNLKFFLCTDDIKFQARRERDDSYMKNLFNKVFNGPKVNEQDLNLNESHKVFVAAGDCRR